MDTKGLRQWRSVIGSKFSLKADMASPAQIDVTLRSGVELTGATPLILVCAILIACIGLNVNSPAVIIGAMLISPLMGPIMGIGYGLGVTDVDLIKKSATNLLLAGTVSLVTATAYFAISPLNLAKSEILARTSPTIWDVIVALFGGLAGIIGATRKEKSNVIPGVAIATALMPPLCTAGFALSQGHWAYFFGAFYLFSINAVFIAVASFMIVRLLRLPSHESTTSVSQMRLMKAVAVIALLTAIPSIFVAYTMVQQEIFKVRAENMLRQSFMAIPKAHIAELNIDARTRKVELSLIGASISDETIIGLQSGLHDTGLHGTILTVHQGPENRIDVHTLKEGIVSKVYQETLATLDEKNKQISALEKKLSDSLTGDDTAMSIAQEILVQYPFVKNVTVGRAFSLGTSNERKATKIHVLNLSVPKAFPPEDVSRLVNWFRIRSKDPLAEVSVTPAIEGKTNKSSRALRK
jgi:uncharacterized hydrophobic protein (TIGR00271 family)